MQWVLFLMRRLQYVCFNLGRPHRNGAQSWHFALLYAPAHTWYLPVLILHWLAGEIYSALILNVAIFIPNTWCPCLATDHRLALPCLSVLFRYAAACERLTAFCASFGGAVLFFVLALWAFNVNILSWTWGDSLSSLVFVPRRVQLCSDLTL